MEWLDEERYIYLTHNLVDDELILWFKWLVCSDDDIPSVECCSLLVEC